MSPARRQPTALRAAQLAAGALFFAYLAQALIPAAAQAVGPFFETWVYPALSAIAAGFCLARAALHRSERAAWLVIGAGVLASSAGDVWWQLAGYDALATIPPFTPADALWLAFYPACLAGIGLLVRSRVRHLHRGVTLDGVIAALGMTAVGAALVWGALVRSGVTDSGGDFPTDLANFFGDLVLIGAAVAALAVMGWRPGRRLALLGGGLLLAAAADGFFLWQGAAGVEVGSTAITALTPGSLLLVGIAAWQPPAPVVVAEVEGWRSVAMGSGFAFAALAVVVAQAFEPPNGLALGLAAATLAAVIVRMAVALRDHMRLLQASRRDALTDSLTGLGNRRLLMLDLEARIATAGIDAPCTVMLFDLDGFKRYNDWYGHPAGDALLARIGHRLSAATEPAGRAYRLGGDEFCVIFTGGELEALRVRDAAAAALVGEDRGFRLGSSLGAVTVPREAATVTSVLKLADERLYAHKARTQRQPAARAQPNVNA